MLVILFKSKRISEILLSVLLIFEFPVFYSSFLANLLQKGVTLPLPFSDICAQISSFFLNCRMFIVNHIPSWPGIIFFGHRIMQTKVDTLYKESYVPLLILVIGLLIRFVITRYIKHNRLRDLASEYWFFITGYFITTAMISYITHLSFIWMLVIPLVIIFFASAGVFRVIVDIMKAIWKTLILLYGYFKLLLKYLALIGAKFSKFLRRIVKVIVDFYNNYIIRPLSNFYNKLQGFREKADEEVNNRLATEKYEENK